MTAMPSPRPAKPRPLELVPRTLTASGETPRRSARRRRIPAACGASLGASAITTASQVCRLRNRARRRGRGRASRRARCRPLPGGIVIGKLLAERPEADRPEHRVRDGVQQGVSVGVSLQAVRVRDLDAAEPQGTPLHEGVRVEADPDTRFWVLIFDSWIHSRLFRMASAISRSSGVVILKPRRETGTAATGRPSASQRAASSVASRSPRVPARECAPRNACGVPASQSFERSRVPVTRPRSTLLTVSGTGIAAIAAPTSSAAAMTASTSRGDERPRRVVNDDHVVSGDAARLEGQANGFATRRSTGDHFSFPGDPGNLFDPVRGAAITVPAKGRNSPKAPPKSRKGAAGPEGGTSAFGSSAPIGSRSPRPQ